MREGFHQSIVSRLACRGPRGRVSRSGIMTLTRHIIVYSVVVNSTLRCAPYYLANSSRLVQTSCFWLSCGWCSGPGYGNVASVAIGGCGSEMWL